MDYDKLSTSTLIALRDNKPLDYDKLSTSDLKELATAAPPQAPQDQPERQPIGAVQTGIEHFAKGVTAGYLPQLQALAAGPLYSVMNAATGQHVQPDSYLQERDANIKRLAQEKEDHPIVAPVSEVLGGIDAGIAASPLLPGSGALGAGASLAEKVGVGAIQGAKTGAIIGAASNPGDTEGEFSPLQLGSRIRNAKENALYGGAFGAALPVVGQVATDALDLAKTPAKWTAKKFGKVFSSVPEDTTGRYIENPSAVNSAPARDDISNKIMDMKNTADLNLQKAREDLVSAKESAVGGAQEAQINFNSAKQSFKESLKDQKLTSMAGDVTGAIQDLKQQTIDGSKKAYDILDASGGSVQTKPLVSMLQGQIESMKVNGVPASKSAEDAIKSLEGEQARFSAMGESISMPQAKQVLQGLDKDIEYSKSAGGFAPQVDRAKMQLRSTIDQDVKTQVPAYQEQMQVVAQKAHLLNVTNDLYGTPEKAISNLNGITSEKGQAIHLPILDALGKETGKDLATPVKGYLATHELLTTPSLFENAVQSLPESAALAKAKANVKSTVSSGQTAVDAATEKSDLFKGITAETVTAKQKALTGANSYGAQSKIGPIDEAYGTNFQKDIQARNDLDQFAKQDTHGSRKALIGGTIGTAIGYKVAGEPGALALGALGSAAGGAMDKYSGPVFKAALDKGMTAAQAMKYVAEVTGKSSVAPIVMGKGVPSTGPDKWAQDGIQKLKDHSNDDDKAAIDKYKSAMLSDPKGRELLIQASNFSPGSKGLDAIMNQIKKNYGGSK